MSQRDVNRLPDQGATQEVLVIDRRRNVLGENENPICQKSDRHGHVEDGEMFYVNHESAVPLGNGAQRTYLVRVGDQDIHLIETHIDAVAGIASGYLAARVYENPTVTAAGTALVVRNRNRNYGDDPATGTKVYLEPTYTGADTEADRLETLPVVASVQSGPIEPDSVERILKKNTDYIVQFDNQLGSSISWAVTHIEFYPEDVPAPLP